MSAIRFPGGGGGGFSNSGRESYPAASDPALYPLDADGDEFDGSAVSAQWNNRGGLVDGDRGVAVIDPALRLNMAQGEGLYRDAPSGDFEIVAEINGITLDSATAAILFANMIGIAILDSSGNGIGASLYTGGNAYTWSIATYAYSNTRNNVAFTTNGGFKHWISLRKDGTDYSTRVSMDGSTWTSFTTAYSSAHTVAQVGIGRFYNGGPTVQEIEVPRFNIYPGPTFFVP
jgi:hypothetical protein